METFLVKFNNYAYDQYDAFVVVAEDADAAIELLKNKYPDTYSTYNWTNVDWRHGYTIVPVDTTNQSVVLGSYNAG